LRKLIPLALAGGLLAAPIGWAADAPKVPSWLKADAAAKNKARAQIDDVLKQAKGGADFAKLAQQHSQDGSAAQGGDLGFFPRGQMVPPFDEAAFALKPGEVSEVVETTFGLHLITVTDRKPGTPVAFEKCVEEVRDAFAEDFRTELVGKLRKQAQVQVTVP